jgi:gamma-glutamylcyclotransferase (GGCT)/AIG2-like uncharacterized protein YtfP
MLLFVNGTLMRGETLHDNLHGCTFLLETRTASGYRLYAMGDGSYPGMVKADAGGAAILGELYQVPAGLVQVIFEREPPYLPGQGRTGRRVQRVGGVVRSGRGAGQAGDYLVWWLAQLARAHEHRLNIRPAPPVPGSGYGWR